MIISGYICFDTYKNFYMYFDNIIEIIGAIATALMALAALVTIIISLKLNRKNKELQINTFKYQQDMAWLNELRKAFVNFMELSIL